MKLKSIAAILVAGLMVVSVPMVAMAAEIPSDPYTSQITGNQTAGVKDTYQGEIKTAGGSQQGAIEVNNKNIIISAEKSVENTSNSGYGIHLKGNSGADIEIGNDVKSKDYALYFESGSSSSRTVTINGNVISTNSYGIRTMAADIGDTTITVKGDINAKNRGIAVMANSKTNGDVTVIVEGKVKNASTDEGIYAYELGNGSVLVQAGSVEADGTGISASNTGTTVNVIGEVKAIGNNKTGISAKTGAKVTAGSVNGGSMGVYAQSGAKVIVKEDVKATNGTDGDCGGVIAKGANTIVVVNGDVSAPTNGISVEDGATIIVLGTVEGGSFYGATNADGTGTIVAYEIKSGDTGLIYGSDDNISYIIKGLDGSNISSFSGTTEADYTSTIGDGNTYKYNTAKKNQIITVSVADGYELKAGEIKVTVNADGTYSVKIPLGGGVTLEAIRKAIKQAQSSGSFTSTPTSKGSASAPLTGGTWTNVDGRWTYTNNGAKLINTTAWIQYTNAQGQTVTQKFCFDNNGKMITNAWKQTADGVWNYFGADGAMLVNTTTPDGYVVDANGNWVKAQ